MSRPRMIIPTILLVLFALVVACGDDDPAGSTDTTPPVVTAVTPIDEFHIDVEFSEPMEKSSAEDDSHYFISEAGTPVSAASPALATSPGDSVLTAAAILQPDGITVSISTKSSMAGLVCNLLVQGVSDAHGNDMPAHDQLFTGSNTPDTTPPTIVSWSLAPNSTDVELMPAVTITFSEALQYADLDYYSNDGAAPLGVFLHGATVTMTAYQLLQYNTVYTLQVDEAGDYASNTMSSEPFRFTTLVSSDHTPPTVASITPEDLATGVAVGSDVSITFAEPVKQNYFTYDFRPYPTSGVSRTWSADGKTVTLHPYGPLIQDQQYAVVLYPNRIFDIAGNAMEGVFTTIFTTGNTLEHGGIKGTVSGDGGSQADDPTGALVLAATQWYFTEDSQRYGPAPLGSVIVTGNNTYAFTYLPDDKYYPLALFDSNHDGLLDPRSGDAIGGYGMDIASQDIVPDSVMVVGGSDGVGIDFPLFDPSAISGTVTYDGEYAAVESAYIIVGLFDSPGATEPVATGELWNANWPGRPWWNVNSLVQVIPDGTYYVRVYLDVDDNREFDPAIDPSGFYGGSSPTTVFIANGHDVTGLVIPLVDPLATSSPGASVVWGVTHHNASLQRLCDALEQYQLVK